MKFLIGSYSESKRCGIYTAEFDEKQERFRIVNCVDGNLNPSFLAVTFDDRHVYAVNETVDGPGAVVAYRIDPDGALVPLNRQSTAGLAPCYVSASSRHHMLVASNYLSGSLRVFALEPDGRVGSPLQLIEHHGHGPNSQRQTTAHPHAAVFDASQDFLLVPDLGSDTLFQYRIDHRELRLWRTIELPPGSGPRHLTFSADGHVLYLISEMANTVTVFHRPYGDWQPMQTLPSLPNGYVGESTASDIHLSPDGRYVYAANRGDDSIVVYGVGDGGELTLVNRIATGGRTPRNFAISPDGNILLVANQDSNNVTAFRVDRDSGRLTAIRERLPVASPSCLLFLGEGVEAGGERIV
ncbi:lactonase family protein [Telmatospirillum sp.]|uniref:lactonase family protein n=1 Tax=Telmatospirillum sp. TaxID=2079197 RepID=UPI00283F594B|nr:lactonase family protein [Telmatospirillum sp.]MDR3435100.1 lactonase family protein [Telmatospirillum sp.]